MEKGVSLTADKWYLKLFTNKKTRVLDTKCGTCIGYTHDRIGYTHDRIGHTINDERFS